MDRYRRTALFARVDHYTKIPMLLLTFAFLAIVLLPEVMHLSLAAQGVLDGTLWIVWGTFAVELGIKTYLAPDRRRYLTDNWPDVLSVAVPFLRPLRLLRIAVSVARAWKQARRVLYQRTVSLIGVTSLSTVAVSATAVYVVERTTEGPIQSYADALWWAVTTITTVGYGDMYPTTAVGRGVAVFLMLTGITLFGLLTASIAAFFVGEDTQAAQAPAQRQWRNKRPRPRVSRRTPARKLPLPASKSR